MLKRLKKRKPILYSLIMGGGLIFFWRGAWGLMDLYLLPHIPAVSYIVSIIIGILILLLDDWKLEEIENR